MFITGGWNLKCHKSLTVKYPSANTIWRGHGFKYLILWDLAPMLGQVTLDPYEQTTLRLPEITGDLSQILVFRYYGSHMSQDRTNFFHWKRPQILASIPIISHNCNLGFSISQIIPAKTSLQNDGRASPAASCTSPQRCPRGIASTTLCLTKMLPSGTKSG